MNQSRIIYNISELNIKFNSSTSLFVGRKLEGVY